MRAEKWTDELIEQLQTMIGEGLSYADISARIGRSVKAINAKVAAIKRDPKTQAAYNRRKAARDRAERAAQKAERNGERVKSPSTHRAPDHVLADRDRRALAPRSLTSLIFGDPPQGMSALDKRMAGAE